MTDRVFYLTVDGLKKLNEELHTLVHVRRREIAARIQEAKELGDLSENAEYQEAKNEQAFNEGRIEELENTLKHAVVIEQSANANGIVQVGSAVSAQANGQALTLHIVGSNEADPLTGRISNESPLGQALLGQVVGATVKVATPKGEMAYTIKSIS